MMEASVINLLQNSPEAVSDRYRASFFSSPGLSHNDTTINDYRESEFNRLFQYSMDSFRSPGESAMYREPLYRPGEDLSPRDGGPDYRHTESFY